jgi:hypothetical protein
MALSEKQAAAITAKRARQQAVKDFDLEQRRMSVVGTLTVDAVWSNKTSEWFCLACEAFAPRPTVRLATLDLEAKCAFCRRLLTAGDDRHRRPA